MSHIGYKKLSKGRIAKLEILGENNEDRSTIANALYAKNRCERAKVLAIYDMHTKKTYRVGYGIHDSKFRYQVGQIVAVKNYDTNHDEVCAEGIHYFLSEDAAYSWNFCAHLEKYTGVLKMWHDNGEVENMSRYKNGLLNGVSRTWFGNGVLHTKVHYVNGCFNGKWCTWHTNGKRKIQCNYNHNKLDGLYEEWYGNGELARRHHYKNGLRDGSWEEWFENGKHYTLFTYKDGISNGPWNEYHLNGQCYQRGNYVDNCMHGLFEEFDDDGTLLESGEYNMGKRIGVWEKYGKKVDYTTIRKRKRN